MYKIIALFLMGCAFSTKMYAFTCYITIVKDSCWKKYNVIVKATNGTSGAEAVSVTVPAGEPWARQTFECAAGETLALEAQFNPVFWESDEGRKFPAQRYWKLPTEIESGVTGWNVTVCYPKWFSNVPSLPDAAENCKCDTDSIPPVPPLKQ
ncbi:MAG: hypothetical protein Q8R24_01475 [Legionellaceae bacterium]|nr:hypothetical protein [Legionellaceae bacterium]